MRRRSDSLAVRAPPKWEIAIVFNPLQYPLALMESASLGGASAWTGHIPFAFALVEMMRPTTLVELGTHRGDSYFAFCQAVEALRLETRCAAIDTWPDDTDTGVYGDDVFEELAATHEARYSSFSRLIRSTFDEAAPTFPSSSIDVLHIDGLHSYQAVKHDFETWLPKLSERGVVLLHGVAARAPNFGVWRLWSEIAPGRPHFAFEHASGLGVLGVGNALSEPMLRFFEDAQRHPQPIRRYFARLGEAIALSCYRRFLGLVLARQQAAIDNWRMRTGKPVGSSSASAHLQAATRDGISFAGSLNAQLDAILVEDLQLRQQIALPHLTPPPPSTPAPTSAPPANAGTDAMPSAPAAKPLSRPNLSVIICSIDDQKFAAVEQMYHRLFAEFPHEIIRIPDAASMAEGYNRGIATSTGDVLIFSHDDVEFIVPDLAARLLGHLEKFDLIGLAGTSLLCGDKWLSAGTPYLFGQVSHPNRAGYKVGIFGAPRALMANIQAVDGLFIAVNRTVIDKVRFDESIGGFHLYDVDFSYSAFLAGFKLAVANDIHAIHASEGKFGDQWAISAQKFVRKWGERLPARPSRTFTLCQVIVATKQEIWDIVHPACWEQD